MQGREKHGKTRDELMYWKSLNPCFKVVLQSNFRSTLGIPLYFSENVKSKLPPKVALKGPGVDLDMWEVQVKTSNDTTWFVGEGWEHFVAAFSLKENDILVFKYKNNSYFKVTVFDGSTSCEKESSHFVVKSVSEQAIKESYALPLKTNSLKPEAKCEKADQSSQSRSTVAKVVTKQDFDVSSDDEEPPLRFRKRGGRLPESLVNPIKIRPQLVTMEEFGYSDDDEEPPLSIRKEPGRLPESLVNPRKIRLKLVTKREFGYSDDGEKPASNWANKRKRSGSNGDNEHPEPPISPRNVIVKTEPGMDYESSPHRECSREQTTNEIRRARQRAEEIQSFRKNSFFVALSRSHVTGNMRLGVPKQWWNEVVKSRKDECMKIRIKGKVEYDQQLYYCHYEESKCTATITTGWRKFVQENSLYEYDCCVFSLAKPLEENYQFIHMEVEIVRAILSTAKIEPS